MALPLDKLLDCLVIVFELTDVLRETLVADNVFVAVANTVQHPWISKTPSSIVSSKLLIDDGSISTI